MNFHPYLLYSKHGLSDPAAFDLYRPPPPGPIYSDVSCQPHDSHSYNPPSSTLDMDSQLFRTYATQPAFISSDIDPTTTDLTLGLNDYYLNAPTARPPRQIGWGSVDADVGASAVATDLFSCNQNTGAAISQLLPMVPDPYLLSIGTCSFEPNNHIIDHQSLAHPLATSESTVGMARNFSSCSFNSALDLPGFSQPPSRDSTPGLLPCTGSGISSTQVSPNLLPAPGPASKTTFNSSSELPHIRPYLFPCKEFSQSHQSHGQQCQPSTYQLQASRSTTQLRGGISRRGSPVKIKTKLGEIYPCQFFFAGCHSTFPSRNEWKRHMATFHIMKRYYKCTEEHKPGLGPCNEVFNRPDLLMQHVRRNLKEEGGDEQSVPRAEVERRRDQSLVNRLPGPPPPLKCPDPQCNAIFSGVKNSWDARAEHISKHLEDKNSNIMNYIGNINYDYDFIAWALSIGAIQMIANNMFTCKAPIETTHQTARKLKKAGKKTLKTKKQILRSK